MVTAAPLPAPIRPIGLTPDDIALITAAADADGRWCVAVDVNDAGHCYAGLIDQDADDYEFRFVIERQPSGLTVCRPCGEVVAVVCTSVHEVFTAVRRGLRH
jgi:hypothetical protein